MALLARSGEGQKTASLKWLALKLDGPGAEPLGNDFRALMTSTSATWTGGGAGAVGVGGELTWGCFANISAYTSAEAWASPSEVRAWVAFLYWPSSMARRARLALAARRDSAVIFLGFLRRWVSLSSSSSTSDQSPMMSPACHLLILARTVFKVSRQLPRPPLAGLARTHRASMKDLHQASKSEESMVIALKTSYMMPAHASLAPFGTWWSVATLTPRI